MRDAPTRRTESRCSFRRLAALGSKFIECGMQVERSFCENLGNRWRLWLYFAANWGKIANWHAAALSPSAQSRERQRIADEIFFDLGGATARAVSLIQELFESTPSTAPVNLRGRQPASGGAAT